MSDRLAIDTWLADHAEKKTLIAFVAPPGTGKTTTRTRICENYPTVEVASTDDGQPFNAVIDKIKKHKSADSGCLMVDMTVPPLCIFEN